MSENTRIIKYRVIRNVFPNNAFIIISEIFLMKENGIKTSLHFSQQCHLAERNVYQSSYEKYILRFIMHIHAWRKINDINGQNLLLHVNQSDLHLLKKEAKQTELSKSFWPILSVVVIRGKS